MQYFRLTVIPCYHKDKKRKTFGGLIWNQVTDQEMSDHGAKQFAAKLGHL